MRRGHAARTSVIYWVTNMDVLDRLASSLGRRDEAPNVALARDLATAKDGKAIVVLAGAILSAKTPVRHDAVKTLYEIGAIDPSLIAPHADAFLAALKGKDNRMIWGALTALDALAAIRPEFIAANLPAILDAADRSSVIAKDKAVSMLATLASQLPPFEVAWRRLIAILHSSADNQTPMYAEAALRAAPVNNPGELAAVVRERAESIAQPAKKARLEKVLRQLARLEAAKL